MRIRIIGALAIAAFLTAAAPAMAVTICPRSKTSSTVFHSVSRIDPRGVERPLLGILVCANIEQVLRRCLARFPTAICEQSGKSGS